MRRPPALLIYFVVISIGGLLAAFFTTRFTPDPSQKLSLDQGLIVACFKVDKRAVVEALRRGANVNARFGDADNGLLSDPWDLGFPVAAKAWTPLIALASSARYPDPPRKIENTETDLAWARREKEQIPNKRLAERRNRTLAILNVLLSHKCDLNLDDGHGATALYAAIYDEKEEFAKVLLGLDVTVNTKTGVYIDGGSDYSPLHRAHWSVELTRLLLAKGADPTARDSSGNTPLDWARRFGNTDVVKLYTSR